MAIKTIRVKDMHMVHDEAKCSAGVTPGHLIQYDSSNSGQVKSHATSGGNAVPMFALEDGKRGRNISQAYSSGDRVTFVVCNRGDEVQCRIANGQSVSIYDYLESNGDGTMKVHTADVDSSANTGTVYLNAIVLQALEAVDMSDSSSADPTGLCRALVV